MTPKNTTPKSAAAKPSQCAAHAPYNFVPFPGRILTYDAADPLPGHDRIDPALKTGEIHLTMRAQTPVFVSDGNEHFFRTTGGQYALPGSTVRGMTRANMQILGFGAVRPGADFENRRFFFRCVGDSSASMKKPLKTDYTGRLDVQTRKISERQSVSIPKKVRAGYLSCQNGEYLIRPAKYYRVPEKRVPWEQLGYASPEKRYANAIPVCYRVKGEIVSEIRRREKSGENGLLPGVLLCPGKSPKDNDRIHSSRYLFGAESRGEKPVPVSEKDALAYRIDWETRKNSLRKSWFWALPKEGEASKPVFFLEADGHVYFGMSLFLRIGYVHTLTDGLPRHHSAAAEGAAPRDYIEAILGWADKRNARRSRVFFGDLTAQGNPRETGPDKAVLGQPKPSWFAGYTVNGLHYNMDGIQDHPEGFCLRGQKRYWLLDREYPVSTGKENVDSTLRPLPAGTEFCGVVRYRNLRPHELGLLLWALRLEDGCYQSVGMGKPYGFGRMSLTIDSLLEYGPDELYCTPDAAPRPVYGKEAAQAAERYIRCYDAFAAQRLGIPGGEPQKAPSIRQRGEIKDFFFLCRKVLSGRDRFAPREARYMRLGRKEVDEYQNLEEPLPSVEAFRDEDEQDPLARLQALQKARDESFYGKRPRGRNRT